MPVQATVTHEGNELTVEVPDDAIAAAGFVPKADYVPKDFHEKEIGRVSDRFKSAARDDIRAELESDEDFIRGLVKKHGKSAPDVDPDALREKIREEEVAPWKERAQTFEGRALEADILRAADWNDQARKNPILWEALKSQIAKEVEYDAEHGFIVKTADGRALPGSGGATYAGIGDLVEAKAETFEPFLQARERNGKGSNPSPGQGAPPTKAYQDMSEKEKTDFIAKYGPDGVKKALGIG